MHRLCERSRQGLNFEINVIPFLDLLLILLLIFISTTPSVTHQVEVNLPDTRDYQPIDRTNDPVFIIEISGVGMYRIVGGEKRLDFLSKDQIITGVQRTLSTNPKTVFLIGGAKDVPYDEIIKVIHLLHREGVKSVGLMTQPI